MADVERWVVVQKCDKHLASDLQNVLEEGVVESRVRELGLEDDVVIERAAFTGLPTNFGAQVPERYVVEVRAEDEARARVLVDAHLGELQRAVEAAAGVAPATSEQLAADEKWMQDRREHRRQRILSRFKIPFVMFVLLVGGGIVVDHFRPDIDVEKLFAPYGDVREVSGGYSLELDPARSRLYSDPLGDSGAFIVTAPGAEGDIYFPHPDQAQLQWILDLRGKPDPLVVRGAAKRVRDVHDPVLSQYLTFERHVVFVVSPP